MKMIPRFQPSPQLCTADRERRIRREGLRRRGRSRLKWLKMGTCQGERNCPASVRHIQRRRNDFEPLPDNSPLCQVVADRAIRAVVAACGVSGQDRKDRHPAFAATLLPGMVNAGNFVQLAPKQRRDAENAGEAPPQNQTSAATQHGDFPRKYATEKLRHHSIILGRQSPVKLIYFLLSAGATACWRRIWARMALARAISLCAVAKPRAVCKCSVAAPRLPWSAKATPRL